MANHPNRKKAVDRAEQNAAAWYSSIAELVAALGVDYARLEELIDARETLVDQSGYTSAKYFEAREELAAWDMENGDELRELTAAATIEGDLQKDADAVRERIQEGPLSVEVRGDWHIPGEQSGRMPTEFNILLSTGGPALRLMGDLDEHGEPTRAYLQHQDWGTPWTDYYAGDGSAEVLLTYAQQFYFGE